EDPYLVSTIKSLRELEVPIDLLSAGEIHKRFPPISTREVSIGILERESGVILARRAVELLVETSVRRGAVYRKALVLPPAENGYLKAIRTAQGEVFGAQHFVFACGPWLPKIFPVTIGGSIQPTRQEVFFFATPGGGIGYDPSSLPT